MDGWQYEEECADYLRRNGFIDVKVTSGSGDQGIDIIAYNNGLKYGIQCKYYENPVANKAIQEAYAGSKYYDCDKAMVMTNNIFTKSAQELAQKTEVILLGNMSVENMSGLSEERGVYTVKKLERNVKFSDICESDEFKFAESKLSVIIGKDIYGKTYIDDLIAMPHLLITGTTGSGKTTCLYSIIMSILNKVSSEEVKLAMIDLKRIEFNVFEYASHLFCPIIHDSKEATASLNWLVRELNDRYSRLGELKVRNFEAYNSKIQDANGEEHEKMPYIVVIIDEAADIFANGSYGIEPICQLVQRGRAVGIHLVIATQWINQIPKSVLESIPSRITFAVTNVQDSRTILGTGGAENLVGNGDLLYKSYVMSEPIHLQGAEVTDSDFEGIQKGEQSHFVENFSFHEELLLEEEDSISFYAYPEQDEYFEDAGRFVIESERAAAGQLQRHFSISFNRAGRIIDQLHKAGVVGSAEGTRPRKVLMTLEEFEKMFDNEIAGTGEEGIESLEKDSNHAFINTNEKKEMEKEKECISELKMGVDFLEDENDYYENQKESQIGTYDVIVSETIMNEYERKLNYPAFDFQSATIDFVECIKAE